MALLSAQSTSLEKLAEQAVQAGQAQRADIKVSTKASVERRLVIEAGEFSLANMLESQSVSVSVHKDQKKGSASTNITTPDAVAESVKSALQLASYGIVDPALNFVDAKLAPRAKVLPFMYDEALANLGLGAIKEYMTELLAVLSKDRRISLDRFEMTASVSYHGLRNSLGMHQEENQTMLHWSYLGMARDGEEVSGMDYTSGFSYQGGGFMDHALKEAEQFVTKLVSQLKPRQCPSYKGAILLSPRAVEEVLLGNLFYDMSGRSVMDGKSRWEKKIGERVVSEALTIVDYPHDSALSGATTFDGDGIPTEVKTLIEKGVLRTHLHDCYSAKKVGVKPNGASGAPFCMHVAPGNETFEKMARARPELLYVDRFSGNADPLTGDFSGVVKGGRLFVNGNDSGAVAETMIAGNVFTLAAEILAVANQVENVSGSYLCPAILVDGVTVSGA